MPVFALMLFPERSSIIRTGGSVEVGFDGPLLPGGIGCLGSALLLQAAIDKISMAESKIERNLFISITVHIHHGADEEWQIGFTVNEHIDKGPIQHDFPILLDFSSSFCNHLYGSCSSSLSALFCDGNI